MQMMGDELQDMIREAQILQRIRGHYAGSADDRMTDEDLRVAWEMVRTAIEWSRG